MHRLLHSLMGRKDPDVVLLSRANVVTQWHLFCNKVQCTTCSLGSRLIHHVPIRTCSTNGAVKYCKNRLWVTPSKSINPVLINLTDCPEWDAPLLYSITTQCRGGCGSIYDLFCTMWKYHTSLITFRWGRKNQCYYRAFAILCIKNWNI